MAIPWPPKAAALIFPIRIASNVHIKVEEERSITAGREVFRILFKGDFSAKSLSDT
jgi:hypothetical protein